MIQPIFTLLAHRSEQFNGDHDKQRLLWKISSNAVTAINYLLYYRVPAIAPHVENYMIHIIEVFVASELENTELRKTIIEGVAKVLDYYAEVVMRHLNKVEQFLLLALSQRD
jgi:hypothetical protein